MKNKKLIISSILLIAVLTILLVISFTNDKKAIKDSSSPKQTDNNSTKTVKMTAKTKFAYDTVSALFNGKQFTLSLDDKKNQCNGKDLYLQLRKTEQLELLNNIYVNDNGEFFLSPDKTFVVSNVLFNNISFTDSEKELLAKTEFSKIPLPLLDKLIKFTYYGARADLSKKVLGTILKTTPSTRSILLNFRKNTKTINYMEFLPDNYLKFNGTLLFENKVVSRKINKDEIVELMKAKVNLGTIKEPKYGITLNSSLKPKSEITVFSCQDLIGAFAQRFVAQTDDAKSAQRTFYTIFNVLSAAAHHKSPQKNLFPNSGLNSLEKIPVTMLPAVTQTETQELRKHGGTVADLVKSSKAVKIIKSDKEYLHLFYNHAILFGNEKDQDAEDGMELILSEVMRGDFNGDGFNSIFLQAQMRVSNDKPELFAFMLISMKEENSNFIQMNIPWK